MLLLSVYVAVHLSITCWYCIKMAKRRIMQNCKQRHTIVQEFLVPMYDRNGKSERKYPTLIATSIAQR